MGKFEKEIKRQMDKEVEEYGVWFERNKDKLARFDKAETEEEIQADGTKKIKAKKKWLIPMAFVLLVIGITLCFLPMMLSGGEVLEPPQLFGDEAVYSEGMNAEGIENLQSDMPELEGFTIYSGVEILMTEDQSLVFRILDTELELEDYYLVTVQIEYNPYYNFLSKHIYEDLESKMAVNGYAVSYELSGTDDLGLYRYYMRTEQNGQKIYWEIHCFEESIEQFIAQVLN
mgnify:FL=1